MKRILTVLFLSFLALPLLAQSAQEIASAVSMAKSYGYSDDEINSIMNHDINGKSSGPVVVAAPVVESAVPDQALIGDVINGKEQPITVEPVGQKAEESPIFGHDFFISNGLSLIPSVTAPVPESYVLGPGDQILIDIWGNANASLDMRIASNGSISVPKLGPVFVSGKKLGDAEKYLKSRLTSIYSGLADGSVSLSIAVGKIRGVSVYVLGAVMTPGVYTLPSLCSAATAIYMAGGIKKMGSVRNIFIFRGGKKVATFDLYKFIFDGEYDNNLRLQDGDIISVSTVENVIDVSGPVRTESKFEMKEGETVADLIRFAGGFGAMARTDVLHIDRKISMVATSFDVTENHFSDFKLCNGDGVYISSKTIQYNNRVNLEGNVKFPGNYAITDKISTLKELIDAAGGLVEGTYMRRASIKRLDKDRLRTEISFILQDIMDGKSSISLNREDSIKIYSKAELADTMTVSSNGFVNNPGIFEYRNGMTIGDLLLLSNGVQDGADLAHVEIASKGRESKSQVSSLNLIADEELLSMPLQPYDKLYVRAKENYRDVKTIEVKGEVKYPGYYAVEKNTVRISDVIDRAEGFTDDAYVKGTRLKRLYSDEEKENQLIARKVKAQNVKEAEKRDSLILADSIDLGLTYYVSLNLEEALKNPGSDQDIILKDGDVVEVPQMNNTVKISGAVYLPNTVAYNPSDSWRDYINKAGGFVKGARRGEVYAIYMDGSTAARGSSKFKMEPGMELVVPRTDNEGRRQISAAEIASLTSAVSSIVYMSAILINQLK